jgi:plasmid stabilization system protein ParE
MRYKVLLIEEARIDIKESRKYYKSIYRKLGKRFTADLNQTILKISSNPLIFGFRFEEFRTANLNIFPYQVHYIIEEDNFSVIIFAVLHAYRDPDFIESRLPM